MATIENFKTLEHFCLDCGIKLVLGENMNPARIRNGSYRCHKCWRTKYKTILRKSIQKSHNMQRGELRVEVLRYYGNGKLACVCCGFSDFRALSIDHVDGGGREERRKYRGLSYLRQLKKRGLPKGYQTLCMNCQFIKAFERKEFIEV